MNIDKNSDSELMLIADAGKKTKVIELLLAALSVEEKELLIPTHIPAEEL
jgi:hypothetical protein